MITVVDASAVLAFLLGQSRGSILDLVLEGVQAGGEEVRVPTLFWYEVLNVLVIADRKGGVLPHPLERMLYWVDSLPFETDDDMTSRTRRRIAELASRYRLTAYDASYLELGERVGAGQLLTLDRELLALQSEFPFIADHS